MTSPSAAPAPPDVLRTGTATVHGTFGELLQGYRRQPDGGYQHFLFTLPVDELAATSTVMLTPGTHDHHVHPADRTRALTAAAKAARALGLANTRISVDIESNIQPGKGCASSTTDVMSSIAALLDAAHPQTPDSVVRAVGSLVAKEIEWGDYVFGSSIALCLQRTHTLVHAYETDLRWRIVGIDEGGGVDTAAFHRTHRESRQQARYYDSLATQLDTALRASDYVTAGGIATESALLQQRALPKRHMDLIGRTGDATGALGIAVAHTGTVIGLLFSEHQPDHELRIAQAHELLRRAGTDPRTYTVRE